jgi:hypothetical protein
MNALSNFVDKRLPTPDGLDTTSGANPSNNPDLLADPNAEKMKASRSPPAAPAGFDTIGDANSCLSL